MVEHSSNKTNTTNFKNNFDLVSTLFITNYIQFTIDL